MGGSFLLVIPAKAPNPEAAAAAVKVVFQGTGRTIPDFHLHRNNESGDDFYIADVMLNK